MQVPETGSVSTSIAVVKEAEERKGWRLSEAGTSLASLAARKCTGLISDGGGEFKSRLELS